MTHVKQQTSDRHNQIKKQIFENKETKLNEYSNHDQNKRSAVVPNTYAFFKI